MRQILVSLWFIIIGLEWLLFLWILIASVLEAAERSCLSHLNSIVNARAVAMREYWLYRVASLLCITAILLERSRMKCPHKKN